MDKDIHPYDSAREELKSDWFVKIAVDVSVGFIVAVVTSIGIHLIFGPTSLLIRICCFPLFFPGEFYYILNGLIISPFFTARFFTTPTDSRAFVRAGFLLAGYVATLLAIRLMFTAIWVLGAVWGKVSWTIAVSAMTLVAGMVMFGGRGLTYLLNVGLDVLAWMVRAYYLSKIRFDMVCYWFSDTKIWHFSLWAMRVMVRFCVWYPNPTSLPTFKFSEPETLRRDLEIRKGQFRLLHIRRRIPFLELHADLQPYTFGKNPDYECVSYCWGKRELEHSANCSVKPKHTVSKGEENARCCTLQPAEGSMHLIVLNGCQHYIPTNVHDILHRRSSILRSSCIWIDSICISQLDKEEKNHQVPMMTSIYQRASHVYVCLGEDRNAWLAMAMLNELVLTFLVSTPESFSAYITSLYLGRLSNKDPALTARIEALYQLLSNKWFTRVWVFQEVVFASAITILHGSSRMIWEYFGTLEMLFSDPRYHELVAAFTYSGEAFIDRRFKGLHQFVIMDHMRRERKDRGVFFRGIPLADILRRTSIFEATEPADKIFAVLACADGFEHELKGIIDYTVSLETTLLRVARYELRNGQLLESLHYAGIGWVEGNGLVEIPSWVVDWSIPRPQAGTLAISPQHGTPYRAGTSRMAKISAHKIVKEAGEEVVTKIKIRGQMFDRVKHLTSICDISQEEENTPSILSNLPEQLRWIQEVEAFIATHCSSITQSERQEVLWRVLIGDRSPKTRPAPPSYGKHFQMTQTILLGLQALVDEHGKEDLPKLMQVIRDHGPFGNMTTAEELGNIARDMIRGDALFENPAFPRRMAATDEMGYVGMVPKGAREGDLLVLFWGAEAPFVLREGLEVDGVIEYQIVGECYVHGVMDGEGFNDRYEEQDFVIF